MENDQDRDPRVGQLERVLQEREERIAELEARLEAVRDASSATREGPGAGREDRGSGDGHGRADGWTGQFDAPTGDPRSDARDGGPTDRHANDFQDVQIEWGPDRADPASTGRRPAVAHLRSTIEQLNPVTRKMLAHYHEYGPASPLDAHAVAGGDGDRTAAYRRNGVLREAALVVHVGRGRYATRLREMVAEAHDGRLEEEDLQRALGAVEEALPVAGPPEMAADWPEP